MTEQIKPINHIVAPIWERDSSDYPDLIKVPMEDSKVITYRREIEQPHPQCMKAVDLIRKMAESEHGYKPRHEKK